MESWKALRPCRARASAAFVTILDPSTLRIDSRSELRLPIGSLPPDAEPDEFDRVVRLQQAGRPHRHRRLADPHGIPACQSHFMGPRDGASFRRGASSISDQRIGPGRLPDFENVELSPEDKQLFLSIGIITFAGARQSEPPRNFWIALDTASYRPPYVMEPADHRGLAASRTEQLEAYYMVDGTELRALRFIDFVVTSRPAIGVLRDVRAAALLPLAEPTLRPPPTRTSRSFVMQCPSSHRRSTTSPVSSERLDHVFAEIRRRDGSRRRSKSSPISSRSVS